MTGPEERYRDEMGKEPPRLPDDDPLAWQWDPRLTRRDLRDRLADDQAEAGDDDEPPAFIEGQESLL